MPKQVNKKKDVVSSVNDTFSSSDLKLNPMKDTLNDKDLRNIDISELILYEKACSLICKRYESAARIEYKNYKDKFNKYKICYEKIFSEIENRINRFCE